MGRLIVSQFRSLLALILSSTFVSANTYILGGKVSGVWTAEESPYIVESDIEIERDDKLVIQPGVRVRFARGAGLKVYEGGSLMAEGTKDSMIVFTSNKASPSPGDWDGIYLSGTEHKAILKYCQIEYAEVGIKCTAYASGCSSYDNYSKIMNCVIRYSEGEGIYCIALGSQIAGCTIPRVGNCDPDILFNLIYKNGGSGIVCYATQGYFSYASARPRIYGNVIAANKRNGISCSGDDDVAPDIVGNDIIGNTKCGIYFGKTSGSFHIFNNIIVQNGVGIHTEGAVPYCQFNDVWNNVVNYRGLSPDGNISADPLFVDPMGDYHLLPESPCIDAGSNERCPLTIDLEGNPRPVDRDGDGISIVDIGAYEFSGIVTDAAEDELDVEGPSVLSLYQNYPNPFNLSTEIFFMLPKRSHVRIVIYDLVGRLVRELTDQEYDPGVHRICWDGRDDMGIPVASGVYLYRIIACSKSITKKMIVLR